MAQLALQYSALNHCATREARITLLTASSRMPCDRNERDNAAVMRRCKVIKLIFC